MRVNRALWSGSAKASVLPGSRRAQKSNIRARSAAKPLCIFTGRGLAAKTRAATFEATVCISYKARRLSPGARMNVFLLQYLPIVIFLAIASVLGLAFLVVPALIAPKSPDPEKTSAYECGFNAFDDARMKFDVRFYLVSILFIIFDLEVAFLFPWGVALMKMPHQTAVFAFWSMMVFLGVLTVGFIYEWKKGALEWE